MTCSVSHCAQPTEQLGFEPALLTSKKCCVLSHRLSPVPQFLPKHTQGETGQHLSRCFPSWLGLKSYTKRLGLVWVSLLPQGWGGVWQLFHPLRVPFSVYLAERGACG